MKIIINKNLSRCLIIILCCVSFGQNIISPINGKKIRTEDDNYSILIAGHIYGGASNNNSVFPSPSLLGMLNEINDMDCSFFVSLGDNFRTPNDTQILLDEAPYIYPYYVIAVLYKKIEYSLV